MSSPFKELYEAEHEKYIEAARREREAAKTLSNMETLLSLALVCLKAELLEHDLLWDTRAMIDTIERHFDERYSRHPKGASRKT